MAEVLTEFPASFMGRGNGYKQFFDGRVYRLISGVDFSGTNIDGVRNGIYRAASVNGTRVRVHCESKDPLTLVVQAFPRNPK